MVATRIVQIRSRALELELTEPFGISGGSQERAEIALVEVELADGTVGRGEAAPLPAYNGERVEDALAAVEAARSGLVGVDAGAWRQRALELSEWSGGSASARCALETAMLDALARRARMPLHHWFGGCTPSELVSDVTIPIMEAPQARLAAERWWALGFRTLKVKIGAGDDLERVLAVHAGAPQAALVLDANAALSAEGALALLDTLARRGISVALFEQPVPADDWRGLTQVGARCRVALDETVVTPADAISAAQRLGPPHVINVKLMKSGVVGALDVVATARAARMSLMIGGMLESSLAMSASACFASGLGGFEFVDLDTPLFMKASPFRGGFVLRADTIDVSVIGEGHGVDLASDRVAPR